MKKWLFCLSILFFVVLSISWDEPEYLMDKSTCTYYKRPKVKVAKIDISERECSLISEQGGGVISVSIDPQTGKLVSGKSSEHLISLKILVEQFLYFESDLSAEAVSLDEIVFPDFIRKNFSYRAADGEYVSVSTNPNGWRATRSYHRRLLKYTYSYNLAPAPYIDSLVLNFARKLK
jgi:hypothetical protein